MNNFRLFLFVPYFLSLVLISGCATFSQDSSMSGSEKNQASLPLAPILKFEDLPVPAGFRIMDKESFAFENDKSRVALLKYYGGQNAEQVLAFYKEQMSSFNWNLINIIEYDRKVLNYDNSEESCIVTIQPQGGKSVVTIALSPKSRSIRPEKERSIEYK